MTFQKKSFSCTFLWCVLSVKSEVRLWLSDLLSSHPGRGGGLLWVFFTNNPNLNETLSHLVCEIEFYELFIQEYFSKFAIYLIKKTKQTYFLPIKGVELINISGPNRRIGRRYSAYCKQRGTKRGAGGGERVSLQPAV